LINNTPQTPEKAYITIILGTAKESLPFNLNLILVQYILVFIATEQVIIMNTRFNICWYNLELSTSLRF